MELVIEADGIGLAASLHLPENVPAPVVVCSHGLLSARESPKFVAIGREMSKEGFCVLRFDFSGCGNSPPRTSMGLIEARRCDLRAAISFALGQEWSDGRIGLLGSSLGGFLSLLEAHEHPGLIRATVSWAAPFDIGKLQLGHKRFDRSRKTCSGGSGIDFPTCLDNLGDAGRVLLIHGQLDEVVPWSNAVRIYERLKDPKRLLLLRTADHRISNDEWRKRAIQAGLDWFLAYLRVEGERADE